MDNKRKNINAIREKDIRISYNSIKNINKA